MFCSEYTEENQSVWEDVKHGLIYGSQDFVDKVKVRHLEGEKKIELPQHNSLFREFEPEILLKEAAGMLKYDIEGIRNNQRIRLRGNEKEKRDMLIYVLWKTGRLSNREIGDLFGLTYSMISRSVKEINGRIANDKKLKEQYLSLNSLFKV